MSDLYSLSKWLAMGVPPGGERNIRCSDKKKCLQYELGQRGGFESRSDRAITIIEPPLTHSYRIGCAALPWFEKLNGQKSTHSREWYHKKQKIKKTRNELDLVKANICSQKKGGIKEEACPN